jgi:RNA polymerase sigma factor (sigma-70 family)
MLSHLYEQHWRELCRYIRGRFGGGPPDPQDIAQYAFTQLSSLESPDTLTNPRAFLYRTATNAAIDHLRAGARQSRILQGIQEDCAQNPSMELSPERVLLGKEDLKILEATIMSLTERDRTFFLLNRMEGVSFAEIARRTGMSPSGVRLIVENVLKICEARLCEPRGKRNGTSQRNGCKSADRP